MRGIITCLVVSFLTLVVAVAGNVIWQRLYCRARIDRYSLVEVAPCEPVKAIEAQMAEWRRLADADRQSTQADCH